MLKAEYNEFHLNSVLDIFLWNEGYKCLAYNILIVRNLKSLVKFILKEIAYEIYDKKELNTLQNVSNWFHSLLNSIFEQSLFG